MVRVSTNDVVFQATDNVWLAASLQQYSLPTVRFTTFASADPAVALNAYALHPPCLYTLFAIWWCCLTARVTLYQVHDYSAGSVFGCPNQEASHITVCVRRSRISNRDEFLQGVGCSKQVASLPCQSWVPGRQC